MKLQVENLSFSYGQKEILDSVSFSVESGEFVSLLGANGEGKTTLFRSILGFITPSKGTVSIDSRNLKDIPLKERAKLIAYIPQESKQTFDYSVKNTVLMGLTPHLSSMSMPSKADEEKVLKALEDFDISKLKDKSINAISGGERQLALTSRAIVQNAGLLIFDEPTSSLDYGNGIKVLKKIQELTGKGFGAIVSTHNIEQALNYSSRLILLKNKHIVFDGSSDELLGTDILDTFYSIPLKIEKYGNRFVITEA